MANNSKLPFLLGAIFCGIRYNPFPNHIMDLIEFHIKNSHSAFSILILRAFLTNIFNLFHNSNINPVLQ